MTQGTEDRDSIQASGAIILPGPTGGAAADQAHRQQRGGVLLSTSQSEAQGFTFDDWWSKDGHEAVVRAVVGQDERVKCVKKHDSKGQPGIDSAITLHDGIIVMAEATRALHRLFEFIKQPHFHRSRQLKALWVLEITLDYTAMSSRLVIPAIIDREEMLMAIRIAQIRAEECAAILESTYGGGSQMASIARIAKYREDLQRGWESEAQVYSSRIRDDCFPPQSNGTFGRSRHPVKVRLEVSAMPERYSDYTQGQPGLFRSRLLVTRGGLLSQMKDVVAFVQKEVDAKSSKRQARSFDGPKWLVVMCLDPFCMWQVDDSFNNSDIPHQDLLVPFQSLNHGEYDEIWVVAPANDSPNQATVIKARRDSAITVGTYELLERNTSV